MSFTDTSSVITSSRSEATRSGVIFIAQVVIISSLVAELCAASSVGERSSASTISAGGAGNGFGLEGTLGGGGGASSSNGGGGVSAIGNGGNNNYYSGTEVWFRNLDTQLLRLGSRLDQLMIRMDHLDSRVGRVQSQGHLRFDSIETSMQSTRQRLDLWSNQLNLIEEQLSRKWKNMESRFDSLVTTMDSKLDTKFNLIQRDNRRHNEFISSSFNSVIISQEKLSERVVNGLSEMNSTVTSGKDIVSNSTASLLHQLAQVPDNDTLSSIFSSALANFTLKGCPSTSNTVQQQHYQQQNSNGNGNHRSLHHHHHQYAHQHPSRNNNNLVGYEQLLPPSSSSTSQNYFHHASSSSSSPYNSHHHQQPNSSSPTTTTQVQLITSKVTNMFDELVKRSQTLEAIVKDTFTMSNVTRREVQDGFRALIPLVNQISIGENNENGGARFNPSNGGASSVEVMSMVVEALASSESMSTALVRRVTELSRSIEERFEMVSMTLNGFIESCLRIQEKAPLIEDKIAMTLDMVLDAVDNSTRNATETRERIQVQLLKEQQQLHHHYQRHSHHHPPYPQQSKRNTSSCSDNLIMASLQRNSVNQQQRYAASQGHNVNQAGVGAGAVGATNAGEYASGRNRTGSSTHPAPSSSSLTWLLRGGEEDETGLLEVDGGDPDQENVVDGDEHDNGDNDGHVDVVDSGGEYESEEPLKISRSKLVFNAGNQQQQHHHFPIPHHQGRHHRGGGGSGGNVNLGEHNPYAIPMPIPLTNSEGVISSISGTNIRSPPQSSMTFSSHHNVNDNVNLAQHGPGPGPTSSISSSSSSPALLGVRRTGSPSDNNNGMGVVSSGGNSAHVNSNSNNHNQNGGGDLHAGVHHPDVEELSEEDKKRFWESWLSPPHTPPRRGSVPE